MELIIAERDGEPPASRFTADTMVGVRIGCAEVDMRARVKQAGGQWHRRHKVWELRYAQVAALHLAARIVEEEKASTSRDQGSKIKHLHRDALVVSNIRFLSLDVDASIYI